MSKDKTLTSLEVIVMALIGLIIIGIIGGGVALMVFTIQGILDSGVMHGKPMKIKIVVWVLTGVVWLSGGGGTTVVVKK